MKVLSKDNLGARLRTLWRFFWRRQTLYALILLFLLVVVVARLSIFPEGASETERALVVESRSLSTIAENPLYLPYKIAAYAISFVSDSVRALRALSIVLFSLCIVALYRILKRWHSDTIALLATGMFATSALALSIGRYGTPIVMLFGWPLVIALLLWVQHGTSKKVAPVTLLTICAVLAYVPGAPYFFVLLSLLFIKKILSILRSLSPLQIGLGAFLCLILLLPLIISMIYDVSILKEWLLLPQAIDWSSVPRNLLRIPSAFIYRAPVDPLLNVGRLPILDVASGALMLIGLYTYQRNMKLERAKVILLTGLFSIILGALGATTAAILILMPFVFIVIAAGITQLLDKWYEVFPRNPFARSFGLVLLCLVVAMSMFYQATRFFIVWPLTPETRDTYNQSRLVQ